MNSCTGDRANRETGGLRGGQLPSVAAALAGSSAAFDTKGRHEAPGRRLGARINRKGWAAAVMTDRAAAPATGGPVIASTAPGTLDW